MALKQKIDTNQPISVSEYIEEINSNLSKLGARIIGEVSSFKTWPSGHVYFSLKDKKGESVIDCKMWKDVYKMCGVKLEDGMEIITSGIPSVWAKTGRLSFTVSTVELSGEGSLKKAYEELKRKLVTEGLFATERKRKLPDYPQNIGVITSAQGAVISDFLTNVGKHGFVIKLIHSAVEGQQALPELIQAIKQFRNESLDVLVIIRGGGSLESLQAFNNEVLVREVVSFPIPVIAGIGHHKDVSLVSMAADYAPSTPTAAANLLNQIWSDHKYQLLKHEQNIFSSYDRSLTGWLINLNQLTETIVDSFKRAVGHWDNKLTLFEKTIVSNDPRRQFKIGFGITRLNGKIIKRIGGVPIESEIDTQVSDGIIKSRVKSLENYEKDR